MSQTLLREARKRRRLTQERLAELSGVDQTTISRLETEDEPNPTEHTRNALAKALGISASSLRFSAPETKPISTRMSDREGHAGVER